MSEQKIIKGKVGNSTYEYREPYALCHIFDLKINGKDAYEDDFITKRDVNPERAEPYGCGNMKGFSLDKPKKEILEKYELTEEEFFHIAEELAGAVSFGNCGWCV